MATLSSHPGKIFWDTRTIVRATILDLAKYYVSHVHYGTKYQLTLYDCHELIAFFLFIGNQKNVCHRYNQSSSNFLQHADYNDTFLTGSTLRAEKTSKNSKMQVLQTVPLNKICLSAFEKKPHILNEGVKAP